MVHARPRTLKSGVREYGLSVLISLAATALALPLYGHVDVINIIMIYLLAAAFAGLRLGRGPSALTAVVNIIAFDFFFVPPLYTFLVAPPSYFPTFATMLIVALIIANLMIAVRAQTQAAAARERHTAALYAITRDLVIARDAEAMIQSATHRIGELLHCRARVVMCDDDALTGINAADSATETAISLPLRGLQVTIGVLTVEAVESLPLSPEQQRLLAAIADQLAIALERARMSQRAQQAQLESERAAMRNTLLASISHDLRTPLSAIAGAGSIVAQSDFALDVYRRVMLGQMIEDKARDMSKLLSNVLELMRLESGRNATNRDWHAVQDLVGVAIKRNEDGLSEHNLITDLPDDLPLIAVDASLMVQLLSNLIENASKYTPAGARITVAAQRNATTLQLSVEDNGPGLGRIAAEQLFEEFARGRLEGRAGGVGLGLAICRVIAQLHGGEIRALTPQSGGARFEVSLPVAVAENSMNAQTMARVQ